MLGEVFRIEAIRLQIGDRVERPIVYHYVTAILLIDASRQGSSTVLGIGLFLLLILLLLLASLLRPGV